MSDLASTTTMGRIRLGSHTIGDTLYELYHLTGHTLDTLIQMPNNHVLYNMSLDVAQGFVTGISDESPDDYPMHDMDNVYLVEVKTGNDKEFVRSLIFGSTLYNSVKSSHTVGLIFEDVIPEIQLGLTIDQLTNVVELLSKEIPWHVAVTSVGCSYYSNVHNPKVARSESCVIKMTTFPQSSATCLDHYLMENLNKKRRYDLKKSFEYAASNDIGIMRLMPTSEFWKIGYDILESNFGDTGRGFDNEYSHDVAIYQWASVEGLYMKFFDQVGLLGYHNLMDQVSLKQVPIYASFRRIDGEDHLVGAVAFVRRPDNSYIFHSLFMDSELSSDGMGKAMLLIGASDIAHRESEHQSEVTIDTGSAIAPWEDLEDHFGIYKRKCSSHSVPKFSVIASRLPRRYAPYYDVTNEKWVLENE